MGIFYDMVKVSNLAPIDLSVRFDGQDLVIPPGDSQMPKPAVIFAKNQNPVMGSQSPTNPSITGARYLIGVYGTADRTKPFSEAEWLEHLGKPMRLDIEALGEEKLGPHEHYKVSGRGPVMAKSAWDNGVRISTNTEFAGQND